MPSEKPFDDKLSIPELEEKVTEFWEKDKTFEKSLDQTKDKKPFTFYDGPPFATGLPHYGHILASTIKDLIPRYQTMRGNFVRRRWGWDCHGLPIEALVEQKLGISGKKQIEEIGVQKFNETCRSMVLTYVEEWGKMVRRLGRWIEFENSYKTMDRTFMESVWWAFKKIYDKGLAYEGRRVLLYCPRCETPISNFEVAMDNSYKDIQEESVYVKFRVQENTFFLAWTTTPWTLPGNVALAVGKDIDYVKAKVGEEVFILAKERSQVLENVGAYEIIEEIKGSDLVGLSYEPLFDVPAVKSDKAFKVYAADFVTTAEGTGIVHTAVVYGEDDYQLGLKEGLPVVPLLDEKGIFNAESPELVRGQYFKKAEKTVKDDLESRGLLFRRENHLHSYPHCWRCGTGLFYNAIPAWFVNVQKIKPDLLRTNNEEMNWFPDHLKHGRYEKSVEAAPDWNISRNRYWGNPIPVWKCADCAEVKVAGSIVDLGLEETTLYFIRHGESEHNTADVISSWPEPGTYHLTEKGKEQVEKTAEELKSKKIDFVLSSDLLRTKETAEIIGKTAGVPVIFDERLREFNVGIWNGKSDSAFDKARPAEGWWKTAPEGGETWTDIQNRAMQVMHELTAKYPGKKIAIVSHSDLIWLTLLKFNIEIGDEAEYAKPYEVKTNLTDLHRPYIDEVVLKCAKCQGEMRRTPEIFDSWIEAGSMPFAEYHYPFENKELFESRFPAQFVAEYIAQTRAWFYLMHVTNFILFDKAPVENLVTTGTILAEDGTKMSKSKNNYPDPWLVIQKYGVDTLRFYLMQSVVMQADNLNFSEKDLGSVHRKITLILWNVYQYFMTYAPSVIPAKAGIQALDPRVKPEDDKQHVLDKWIRARAKELVIEVTDYLEGYDTVRAARSVEKFIDDLSTWYLRRSRGREDAGFFPTLYETLVATSKVLAPFMPHLAEAVYSNITHAFCEDPAMHTSVHLAGWPEKQALTAEEQELLKEMGAIREAASLGLAARKSVNIPVRQPLAKATFSSSGELENVGAALKEILCDEINVKDVAFEKMTGETPVAILDPELTPELKLEGLTRQLERFVQELRKTQGFKVGEVAVLKYDSTDAEIEKAFASFDAKKTYISAIEKSTLSDGVDFEGRAKIEVARS